MFDILIINIDATVEGTIFFLAEGWAASPLVSSWLQEICCMSQQPQPESCVDTGRPAGRCQRAVLMLSWDKPWYVLAVGGGPSQCGAYTEGTWNRHSFSQHGLFADACWLWTNVGDREKSHCSCHEGLPASWELVDKGNRLWSELPPSSLCSNIASPGALPEPCFPVCPAPHPPPHSCAHLPHSSVHSLPSNLCLSVLFALCPRSLAHRLLESRELCLFLFPCFRWDLRTPRIMPDSVSEPYKVLREGRNEFMNK